MNYAVVAFAGSQFLVSVGDKVDFPNLNLAEGKEVRFDRVLLARVDSQTLIGNPVVDQFSVLGKVVKNFRGEKLDVFKFKAKSRYRRKIGFRPSLSQVEIIQIGP